MIEKEQYYPVLDNGFVAVIDYMGDDSSITRAARVSYGKGTKHSSDDRSLIRYMMRHRHTTPFESCEIQLHIGCPIFVWRQWIRTRTASVSEYSGRYSEMPTIFYTPENDRYKTQSATNKQGSSQVNIFSHPQFNSFCLDQEALRQDITEHYRACLQLDMARELARIDLPLSTYTYSYWKIDLHNLLHFLSLRLDQHAQWEIRQYAQVIAAIVKQWVPLTWEAFVDYKLHAHTFTVAECILFKEYCKQQDSDLLLFALALGMSKREYEEFLSKIDTSVYNDQQYVLPEPRSADYYEKLIAGESS